MKKNLQFLCIILLIVCISGFAQGQTTITIGTGTNDSYSLPINNYYKNSWSEMIYPASDITESGYITSIGFDVSAVASGYQCNTITIYMGTTANEAHSSNSDWLPMDALTEVWSATDWPLPTTTGWLTFDLDNPFLYDGNDNLVIVISKTMPNYTNGLKFRYTTGISNCCLYRRNDNDVSYADHPSGNTGTLSAQLPNLQLTFSTTTDFCHSVRNLTVSDVTSSEATFSWAAPVNVSDFVLQYKTQNEDWEDGSVVTVYPSTTTYTLTNLTPSTYYDVRVANICDNGNSAWVKRTFKTECVVPISVSETPYYEPFEGYAEYTFPDCWTLISGSGNYPSVRSSTSPHSGSGELWLTNTVDNPIVMALPQFAEDLNTLRLSFWMQPAGITSYFGRMEVGVMTDLTDTSTFTLLHSWSAVEIGSATYAYYEMDLDTMAPSSTGFIVFRRYVENGSRSWFLDDVQVMSIPDCESPREISALPHTYSADLTWEDMPGTYNIYYKKDTDADYISINNIIIMDTVYELDNLAPETTYQVFVTTVCEDGSEASSSFTVTFTTLCTPEATPYSEDFNAGNTIPNCWAKYTGLVSDAFAGINPTPTTATGYNYWDFTNTRVFGEFHPKQNIYGTGCRSWLVSPAIDLSGLGDPVLTFDMALTKYNNDTPIADPTSQADDRFLVLISTDDGATWSAENATEWNNNGTGNYVYNQIPNTGEEVLISLAQYEGQTIRIAFYGESTVSGGDNDLHIDNVMVKDAPTCPKPAQLHASNITTHSAELSWTETGNATWWVVEYGLSGFTPGSETEVHVGDGHTSIVLYGLTPGTDYEFHVKADCGAGDFSDPKSATFRTADCEALTTPFTEDFENYTTSTTASTGIAPACWELVQEDVAMTDATRPQLYYTNTFAHSGNYCLKMHNRGIYAMPALSENIAMKDVKLEMYLRQANAAYQLQVGVWEEEEGTFVPVATFNNSTTDVTHVECDFSSYTGDGHRIAFRNVLGGGRTWDYSYNYIDDITLTESPLTPTALPYYTDFSEEADQNWLLRNGNCVNRWMMGTPNENTPSALFITQDGSTASYNITNPSTVMAEKAFFMPSTDFVHVEFDVQVGGDNYNDFLKVFLTPIEEMFEAGTNYNTQANASYSTSALDFSDYKSLTGNSNYPYMLNLTNGNMLHVSANMPNPDPNGTGKIVFLWRNNNYTGTQPGSVVTNFSIEEIANEDLLPPTVTTDYFYNVTTNSAECHGNVTDNGSLPVTARGVCFNTTPNPTLEDGYVVVSGSGLGEFSSQLTGLAQGSTYYVRAYATNLIGTSYGEEGSFTTDCETITLPYSDDFDSYTTDTAVATGVEPTCWTLMQEDVSMTDENRPQLIYNSDNSHSGDYSLQLKYRGIYAMPELPANIAMNRLHLEMYLKQPKTYYALEVGVWEDDGTFVPVVTFNNSTTGMERVECYFSNYTGSGRRIAFHNIPVGNNIYNYSYNFIDDIVLNDIAMVPVALPYSTNFGEDADRNWLLNNGTCTNYWMMGSPDENTPSALFVTQDGSTASYNITKGSTVMAEKAFLMPANDLVHVEFDVLVGGETGNNRYDFLKVFLTPVDETFEAGTNQNTQSNDSYSTYALDFTDYKPLSGSANYPYVLSMTNDNTLHISANMPNPAPNGRGKLVFLWRNDQTQGTQPGAVVTNFIINENTDVYPPTVTTGDISDVTANTATCGGNVTDNGGLTVTERGVCWSTSPNPTLEDAHTVDGSGLGEFISNLTNLSLGVTYYIRAYATNDAGTGYGEEVSFSACDPITQLPYTDDFESYTESTTAATGIAPICWELVQEDVAFTDATRPQLYYKNAFAHSGDYSLLLNYRGVYAMPALSENITMKFMRLKMYLRQPNAAYRLQVGVWDDETSTFTPVATFNNSTTEVEYVECDFSNYTGNGRRIAFRNILGSGNYAYSYNYIDDIALTETAPAFSYTIENVCNSVSVHFENNSTEAENAAWDFGDGTTSEEFAPTHTYQESGTYVVTLSVNNGVCEEWLSVTQNVTVTMPETFTISMPYSDNFDSYTADTNTATGVEPSCWELVQEDVTMTDENRPQLIHNSNYTHSGDYSLQLNYRGIYAMPPLSDDLMLKHVKLEMYLKQPNSYYALEVGVWEDDGTFVPVATFNNSTTDMKHVECDFSIYEGSGRRIAFHNIPVGDNIYDYSYNFIDDLVLTESEGCELTIEMHDLYNDGWTGNKIRIHNDGTEKEVTLNSGSAATATVRVHSGHIALEWVNGQYPNDCSFTVTGPCLYYQAETVPAAGVFYEIDLDCNSNGTPAIPAFTWWTENTCNSVLVHFMNESSDAEFADWDFGDGDWSNEYAPVHEYTSDGTYPVMLSVNNSTCVNVINETNHVTVTMPEPLAGDTTEFIICYGDFPQFWTNNLEINGPGIYTTVIEASNGCDSIVTCSISVTNPITIPYSEGFESYTESSTAATGIEPTCWNLVQQDVQMPDNKRPQLYYRSDFAHSGDYSLLLNYRGIYAMPPLEESMAMKHIHLDMYLRQPNAAYQLEVGVWDDETGTFEPIATFNNSTTGVEHVECDFSNYTGNGRHIAFHNVLGSGNYAYSYNYIDDIVLTESEGCATLTFEMHDAYGDGWNGNTIRVYNDGIMKDVTLEDGADGTVTVQVYNGPIELEWIYGNWPEECTFSVTGPCFYYSGGASEDGVFFSKEIDCNNNSIPAVPAFSYWTENTCNSVLVHFENGSSDAEVASWNFGDGTTSDTYSPTHEYLSSGTYGVELYVYNSECDDWNSVVQYVEVTVPESITHTFDTTVCANQLPLIWHGHEIAKEGVFTNVSVAANGCDSTVILTLNVSDLTAYTTGAIYYTQPASDERFVTVSDYNDDGLEDLVTRIHPSGEIRFYQNTGASMEYDYSLYAQAYAFSAAFDECNNGQSNALSCFTDFDNDGVTDFLVYSANHYNCGSNAVRIYWGSATHPYFNDNDFTELAINGPYCVGAYSADLNNDGLADVLIRNCGPTNLYMNEGNRIFTQTDVFNTGRDINVIFDDYDLDGNVDLCYTKNGWADGQWGIRINFGNGDGTFNSSTVSAFDYLQPLDGFLNFNANPLDDNVPDIAFTCNGENNSKVYIGELNTDGFEGDFLAVDASDETRIVQAFDIDNNGFEDLIIRLKTGDNYSAKAYLNDGHGNFAYNTIPVLGNSPYYPYKFWREGERILMATYHGVDRDSIVVFELKAITCESLCATLVTLPYSEDFDTYTISTTAATGVEPKCWELVQEDVEMADANRPQLYYKSEFAHSGNYSLKLHNRGVYAMPPLDENMAMKHVHLEMYLRQPNAAYQLEVGVWDDETGTFEPITTFNNSTTGVEHVECDFSNYTGNGRRIAFRNTLGNGKTWSYSYNYLDDISLTETEGCELTVENREWWEGGSKIRIHNDGSVKEVSFENEWGGTKTVTIHNGPIELEWVNSDYPYCYFTVTGPSCLYYDGGVPEEGVFLSSEIDCNSNGVQAFPDYISWWTESTCNGVFVHFVNESVNAENAVWDFGDGTTSEEFAPTHKYTADGNYTVTVSVNNNECENWNSTTFDVWVDMPEPVIVTLPYSEDFESYTADTIAATSVEPTCWELVQEDVEMTDANRPQLYYKNEFAHSGNYSLKLHNRGVYAMPPLDENMAMKHVRMEMYLRQPKAAYQLEVGVWDEETSTFTPVASFNNSTTEVEHVECDFSNYTGNGRRIAFRNVLGSGNYAYSYNYIDDIVLTETEGCVLTVENHSTYEAAWRNSKIRIHNDGSMKEVTFGEDEEDVTKTVTVHSGPIELEFVDGHITLQWIEYGNDGNLLFAEPLTKHCAFTITGPSCLYYSGGVPEDSVFLSTEIDCYSESVATPTIYYDTVAYTFDFPLTWHGWQFDEAGSFTTVLQNATGCDSTIIVTVNAIQYCTGKPTMTDIDGNVYHTVKIGDQCWIRENLRTTHLANGETIPVGDSVTSNTEPYYYNFSSNIPLSERGYLYNWPAAQQVCPVGWHLPSDAEWNALERSCGMDEENESVKTWRGSHARLLAENNYWSYHVMTNAPGNMNYTDRNVSGFSAVPTGIYSWSWYNGTDSYYDFRFASLYDVAYFWSNTEEDNNTAWGRGLSYKRERVRRINESKECGYSVRCLRDEMICSTITLPYSEEFDSYTESTTAATGVEPRCWELVQEDVRMSETTLPQLYYKSEFAHSGDYSLKLCNRGIYAMPKLPNSIATNHVHLEMYLRQPNAAYQLEVGVWDDETETFEPITTFNNSTTEVEFVECDFSNYTGNGRRIAFHNVLGNNANYAYSYNYLDDITLTEMEGENVCRNLAELRSKMDFSNTESYEPGDTDYRLVGSVVVTAKRSFNNYKIIQDSTAAILIYDPENHLGDLAVGDQIRDLRGHLINYFGFLEFVPSCSYQYFETPSLSIDTLAVTLAQLNDNSFMSQHQAELIMLENAAFTATGNFMVLNRYELSQNGLTAPAMYPYFQDADYIGITIPTDVTQNIVGFNYATVKIGNNYYDFRYYIVPRFLTDMNFPLLMVSPATITDVTTTTATLEYTITVNGEINVTERGVCWSTEPNPTIDGEHTSDGNGMGTFTSTLTNLEEGTTYYVRAYATNSVGTAYGEEVSFTTIEPFEPPTGDGLPCPGNETVTDYEGNIYNTVQIGEQCWMNENLRTTHYYDGVEIAISGSRSLDVPYCYYPNSDPSNVPAYGYLYNWAAVMHGANGSNDNPSNVRGICPAGWHVPSDAEWTQLSNYAGGNITAAGFDTYYAAGYFAIDPGSFDNTSYFWCTSEIQNYWANFRSITVGSNEVFGEGYGYPKIMDFSVRCLLGDGAVFPTVNTVLANNPSDNTIVFGGEVTDDGGANVTARGVCWGTHPNPTLADSYTSDESGTGAFSSDVTPLHANTTYYVRAYATNSIGTAYGDVDCITTLNFLDVVTAAVGNLTNNSAMGGGNVLGDGGVPVTAYGVCWSMSHQPTLNDAHTVDGSGTGSFTSIMTGLIPDSTYYVRAYATNDDGTVYGDEVCFKSICPTYFLSDDFNDGIIDTTKWILSENNVYEESGNLRIPEGSQFKTANLNIPENGKVIMDRHFIAESYGESITHNGYNIILNGDNASFIRIEQKQTYQDYYVAISYRINGAETRFILGEPIFDTWLNEHLELDFSTGILSFTMDTLNVTLTIPGLASQTIGYYNVDFFNEQTGYGETQLSMEYVGIYGDLALVSTNPVNDITSTSATCGGSALSDDCNTFTEFGVCWSTSHLPTTGDAHSVDSSSTDAFTSLLTDLTPGTTYYVRAYANNEMGSTYGNEVSFTTLLPPDDAQPCPGNPTVTDYDGNVYNTVKIGEQCWMRENLRTTHFADGGAISLGSSVSSDAPCRYYPNNDSNNVVPYGYLYTRETAMHGATFSYYNSSNIQGICPDGWHLPSNEEWAQLTDYLNSIQAYECGSEHNYVAKALSSTSGWINSNDDCAIGNDLSANNITGFNALPAGFGRTNAQSNFGMQTSFLSTSLRYTLNYQSPNLKRQSAGSLALSVRCVFGEGVNAPTVVTQEVINITESSALGSGEITSNGGSGITEFGLVWSTDSTTTYWGASWAVSDESLIVCPYPFVLDISNLSANTTYYVRAYATNIAGTSYGNAVTFTTMPLPPAEGDAQPCPGTPTVTDIDGNVYNTVKIGEQCWMRENLRTTHFADGVDIPAGTSTSSDVAYRYFPNNDTNNINDFGYLYNWAAVMHGSDASWDAPSGIQGICPAGWHVPSDAEWTQLTYYLGDVMYCCDGNRSNISKAMADTVMWNSYDGNCSVGNGLSDNNTSGFGVRPAGYFYNGYFEVGESASFWSTSIWGVSPNSINLISSLSMHYSNSEVSQPGLEADGGHSVRCLRDEPELSNRDEVTEEPSTTPISDDLATESADINSPLGIEESANALESIVVYPNPTRDYINVQCTMNNVQYSGIEVIDVYGKVVRTVVGANNDSSTQINVSDLAAGMYFVRVTTDKGVVTKPFVKR